MEYGRKSGFTLMELLFVLSIIAILMALLLPAIVSSREAARRTSCSNRMMQLGLALKQYDNTHETLPPGVIGPAVLAGYGIPPANTLNIGWIAHILPYLDHRNAYSALNFELGALSNGNSSVHNVILEDMSCPSDPSGTACSYAGCHDGAETPININNRGLLFLNSAVRLDSVPDGLSQTLMLGETTRNLNSMPMQPMNNLTPGAGAAGIWLIGDNATLRNTGTAPGVNNAPVAPPPIYVGGFSSYHPSGFNAMLADGSIRLIKNAIAMPVYQSLGFRDDGGILDADAY